VSNNQNSSFGKAVTRLNSGNLNELWELAALLSVLEYYGCHALDLFPELHFERPRLFCEAILASKSSFLHHRVYTPDDFIKVINWSDDGLMDKRFSQIESGRDRKTMLFDVTRALARMANIQMRYQDTQAGDQGRIVALYDVIPATGVFRDEATASLVKRVKRKIDDTLGCSILELLRVYAKAGLWQRNLYDNLNLALNLNLEQQFTRKQDRLHRLRAVLSRLFGLRPAMSPIISFTQQDLLKLAVGGDREAALDAFRACFCASTQPLRSLLSLPAYSTGEECWHLSPLERFPVVEMQVMHREHPRFAIPNFRFYLRSLPAALDYTLLESLDEEYDQFRGAVLEAYVARLLQDEFPGSIVAPERAYSRAKGKTVRGPDVAFVEAVGEPLLLIEVKARRVLAATRSQMDDDSIDLNLADALSALRRLPSKASDFFRHLEEYSELDQALRATTREQTIGVCVLPDVPFGINELMYYRADRGEHRLREIDIDYCIMGIATFEKAVAVAKSRRLPLSVILREFMARARDLEMTGPLAEFFGEEGADPDRIYGETFLSGVSFNQDGEYASS